MHRQRDRQAQAEGALHGDSLVVRQTDVSAETEMTTDIDNGTNKQEMCDIVETQLGLSLAPLLLRVFYVFCFIGGGPTYLFLLISCEDDGLVLFTLFCH